MYVITRERMSKYTKIVFTAVPEKYEPLLTLLKNISVGIVPGDINWVEKNRKSNSCELKELLVPENLFVYHVTNNQKPLSWDIPYVPGAYGVQNVNTRKIYASSMAFKLNKSLYDLLLDLWKDHEKPKDSFKKKIDQNRIGRNINFYEIFKKSDYLSTLDIYSIIT